LFFLALRSRHRVVYGFQARTAKWSPGVFVFDHSVTKQCFWFRLLLSCALGVGLSYHFTTVFLFARAHHLKNGLEVPLHWLMFFFGAGLDTLSHSRVLVGLLGYLVCTYKHTAAQEHGVPKPSITEDPILRLSDHELDYPLIVVFRNSRL
jgi:hypothetical protein